MQYADLAARLEQVLHDDGDAEELFTVLEREIDSNPRDPSLYTLRARLNDACAYRSPAWRDLQQAAALAPGDREAALELLAYQCRHAVRLAWALADDDEQDDDAVDAHGAQLEAEAVAGLWRLMRDYASDAAFALRLSCVLEQGLVWRPWDRYGLVLAALAANPADWELRKKEALVLAWLVYVGPDSDNVPGGYFEDWQGNRMHALGIERALAAIDALLLERTDADLLSEQAGLLTALERLEEAAAIHARLVAIYEEQLERAAPEARAECEERLERARENYEECAGGPASYLASKESLLAASIEQLASMASASGNKNNAGRVDELKAGAELWRNEAAAAKNGPDPEQEAELRRIGAIVASNTVGLLSETAIALRPLGAAAIAPWFAELAPAMLEAGLTVSAGFENPDYARKYQSHQARLWAPADGRMVMVAEMTPTIRIASVMSRLSDGTAICTTATRGLGAYGGGPGVESIAVFPDTPAADMIKLHGALLARRLTATPGLAALPIRTVAELEQAQNDLLAVKHAWRRSVGMSDFELRGIHIQHHDYFSSIVKEEIAARLAAGA